MSRLWECIKVGSPHSWICIGIVALLAGLIGATYEGRHVKTVTVTEYKDRVVEKQVVVEKPVVEYRDRTITRYVTRPDGTKVETHVEDKRSKETGEKVTTTDRAEEKVAATTTTVSPEGRWGVQVLAGVDTLGGVVAGGAVTYRILGPATVGVWGTGPVGGSRRSPLTLGVSVGLRF